MNIDKPCHNSSCEPTATGRRSKKRSRIYRMRTESLTTDSFFDLSFWCIGIPNGFASVTACGCLGSDCPVICRYLVYIYCPKESKCRHLQNPSKIPLSCQGTIKIKREIKKRIRVKDSVVGHPWWSVSVFWFKLCSRRLTERNAAILSSYNIYYRKVNWD